MDELKRDTTLLCLLKASRQTQVSELHANTDKAEKKLTMWTGRYAVSSEKNAANIRWVQEGAMAKVIDIDNERSAAIALVVKPHEEGNL